MPHASTTVAAPVLEVFASIQGEGRYVGEPQVFLRLAGCPLRCAWCDTPGSWRVTGRPARVARSAGADEREEAWASPFQAAVWVAEVEPGEPRTVSVTGGEPLVWPEFLLGLPNMLRPRRLHLETGGAHPESLARVLDAFDHVSLDLKLPADMGQPEELGAFTREDGEVVRPTSEPAPRTPEDWTLARRRSLQLLGDRDACAKVVVAGGRGPRDFEPLFEDVVRHAPELPVYVAPATPVGGVTAPGLDEVVEVAELARELGLATRLLPQVHRMLGIR